MTISSEVEAKQVRIVKGTGSQIASARQAGEILDTDLVVQTDAPDPVTIEQVNTAIEAKIIDSTSSTSTTSALSANKGKVLQDELDNVKARGRFLSVWNCSTGLPDTNPEESPYPYKAGDYYIVGTVGSGTKYKPNGASFTIGVASTTVETNEVNKDDTYLYDGTSWILQSNTQKSVTFSNLAGSPYDNTNLGNALDSKLEGVQLNGTDLTVTNKKVNVDNVVTTNTAQDITATKTFKAPQKIQSGDPNGCFVIGADVSATTVTAGTRKLGRMAFHTKGSTTLNCAFVSTDTQDGGVTTSDVNCVEFGGRTQDVTCTSPDQIDFTVANTHNTTTANQKIMVCRFNKNGATFSGSAYNGIITVARTTTGGSFVLYKNSSSDLGVLGVSSSKLPLFSKDQLATTNVLVMGGSNESPSVGNTSTPVYVDANGKAVACTDVSKKTIIREWIG